ncbi:MAG: DUF2834 domain-containing protein [Bryobacteraceae bacterium]|nr:DUF2834 domain-containing protein [Bryobacteraceae bacterium]
MTGRLLLLGGVIAAFGVLSAVALAESGYWGIIASHFRTWGGMQVLADLVILALLACLWMVRDAREQGLPAWPFVALTLLAGSFGPLVYLLVRETRVTRPAALREAPAIDR